MTPQKAREPAKPLGPLGTLPTGADSQLSTALAAPVPSGEVRAFYWRVHSWLASL